MFKGVDVAFVPSATLWKVIADYIDGITSPDWDIESVIDELEFRQG